MSRSGLRRALLVVLTVLLVTVGARALRSAASDHLVIERAEHGVRVRCLLAGLVATDDRSRDASAGRRPEGEAVARVAVLEVVEDASVRHRLAAHPHA